MTTEVKPRRIQWNRFMGPLPPNTKNVMRPGKYGNPYLLRDYDRETCLRLYKTYATEMLKSDPAWLDELKGYDLACSCKPGEPCHADVLIELISNLKR